MRVAIGAFNAAAKKEGYAQCHATALRGGIVHTPVRPSPLRDTCKTGCEQVMLISIMLSMTHMRAGSEEKCDGINSPIQQEHAGQGRLP